MSWKFKATAKIYYNSPTVYSGKVFFGAGYREGVRVFYALDENTGEVIWQWDVPLYLALGLNSSPLIANGKVIFGGVNGHYVFALDVETGNMIWQSEFLGNSFDGNVFSSPAYGYGLIYVGVGDNSPGSGVSSYGQK